MFQVQDDFKDLDLPFEFEYLKSKSKEQFKRIVKTKTEEYELKRLQQKQSKHSKMSNLYYTEIILQDYFKTEGITTEEALNMFKWRVCMAPLGENFRNNKTYVNCPLCDEHLDNQSMVFRCRIMRSNITIKMAVKDIYRDNISLKVS